MSGADSSYAYLLLNERSIEQDAPDVLGIYFRKYQAEHALFSADRSNFPYVARLKWGRPLYEATRCQVQDVD